MDSDTEAEVNGHGYAGAMINSAQGPGAGDCNKGNERLSLSSGTHKESNGTGNILERDTDMLDEIDIGDVSKSSSFEEDECFVSNTIPMTETEEFMEASNNKRAVDIEKELIRDALQRDRIRLRQVELQAAGERLGDPFAGDLDFDPLGVMQHPPQWQQQQAKLEQEELFQGNGLGVELAEAVDKVNNLQLQDFNEKSNTQTIEELVEAHGQPDKQEIPQSESKSKGQDLEDSMNLITKITIACHKSNSEQQQHEENDKSKAEDHEANILTKPDVDIVNSPAQSNQPQQPHKEGVGAPIQNLNKNAKSNAASASTGTGKQQRASPRIPNGNTQSKAKSAAVVQKKEVGGVGVVNKARTSEPVAKDVRSTKPAPATTASRRSDAGAKSGSTVPTARPQTSSHRVPAGPSKVSLPNVKSRLTPNPKAKPDQSPSTSSPREIKESKDLFETSPLTAGLSPELTKLAKATPSHLIHPSSSVCRPATSLVQPPAKPKSQTPRRTVGITVPTTPSPAKPVKLTSSSTPSSVEKSRKTNSPSVQPVKMGDADGSGEKVSSLKDQFAVFSRFGDISSDGKQITLSNCDKWMKQAHVIDGKKITTTDTSILFKKLFKNAKKIGFEDFKKYCEELATSKKLEPKDILEKLANCGTPGTTSATKAAHTGVIERLTDTSKYTGSHKERFDSAGKGRGIEGRRNVQDDSGYVAAFKDKKEDEKRKSEGSGASPTPAK